MKNIKFSKLADTANKFVDYIEAKSMGLRIGKRVIGYYNDNGKRKFPTGIIRFKEKKANGIIMYVVELDEPIGKIKRLKFNSSSLSTID